VLDTGAVLCWGENNNGRIGNGQRGDDVTSPTRVAGFGD
jgi:alpha-tubulin suppressor-like RCC1 family protein